MSAMAPPLSVVETPETSAVDGVLQVLEESESLGPQIVHRHLMPGAAAQFLELDPPLPEVLQEALGEIGAGRLWSHQAAGVEAARAGRDVLVTTPTASGKSLVFQVPVLEEALNEGPGRALFLFPLKALGQDQKGKLDAFAARCGLDAESCGCEIYDGDTPTAARRRIRARPPRVLVTNPDMLHLGILAHAGSWTAFLKDLKWIVLDELHTYRGVFGNHFHHVLQRLFRLCRKEGSAPAVIAASATASNAAEFAETLVGRSFTAITETGAPREGRHLLLVQPEASPYTTALELAVTFLDAGLKTIVFTKARRITELLFSWLRRRRPDLGRRVASYRAGFLPEERREIERRLFEGELDGVFSTSALEMGVDIGGLDACVLVGFPGSVMATWQRSGRVGRAGKDSVTALVAMPDALDQYLLEHPRELLERPCERLIVNPANPVVAGAHLLCAAAEGPLHRQQDEGYLKPHGAVVAGLMEEGELLESADGHELFSVRRRPHRGVALRGAGQPYAIRLGSAEGPVVGTVDGTRALRECHPGAVYLHSGRSFQVKELDLEKRIAVAERAEVDFFTSPLVDKETEILEVLKQRQDGPLHSWVGRLRVRERVVGYERKRFQGQQVMGQEPLDLPPSVFETVGLFFAAGRHLQATLEAKEEHFMGGLHACEHAAISLMPTFALCDRGDIGGISQPFHPQVGCGSIFLYDGHSGGVGITEAAFEDLPGLLRRVEGLLTTCPCEGGCPSCVQSPKCGNGNRPLDKAGALRLTRLLLGEEEPIRPADPPPEILLAVSAATSSEASSKDPGTSFSASFSASSVVASEDPGTSPASSSSPPPAALAEDPGTSRKPARTSLPAMQRPAVTAASARDEGETVEASPLTVIFDVETKRAASEVGGWGNAHRMGVAVAVACFLEENRFETYFEDQVWELAAALRAAKLVVGFNVRGFDYKVLNGYTGEDYARTLRTFDLLEDVHRRLGKRIGLSHLCEETLGSEKSADGLQSLQWVKEGRLDLVEAYCRKDVELTRDLYLFGRREGYVLYRAKGGGKQKKLPVDW